MAVQASGFSYRRPCPLTSRGNPSQKNGIPNVFSVVCKVGAHNSQLGLQNANVGSISDSNFFRSLLHAYPKKRRRRNSVIVAESAANVSSDTVGSTWWDNLRGGARPRFSDVVWPAAGVLTNLCVCQIHV